MSKKNYNNLWLAEIAKHHKTWIKTVQGLGGDSYSEDIVQEMYLKINKYSSAEKVFKNGKLQNGYIFFVLRSILYTYLNQRNKVKKSPIEWLINNLDKDKENNPTTYTKILDDSLVYDSPETVESEVAYGKILDKIDLETMNWQEYDRDIFNVYRSTGMSFRNMAKFSEISYTNLYYTVKTCKDKIRDKFGEDWEDFNNNDLENI